MGACPYYPACTRMGVYPFLCPKGANGGSTACTYYPARRDEWVDEWGELVVRSSNFDYSNIHSEALPPKSRGIVIALPRRGFSLVSLIKDLTCSAPPQPLR